MKPKIDYDPKVNILSIKLSHKKSVDSDVKNNAEQIRILRDKSSNGYRIKK